MKEEVKQESKFMSILKQGGDLPLILSVTGLILLMVLPIPSFFLDLFLVASIAISLFILLLAFYVEKPLDFSVFPTKII